MVIVLSHRTMLEEPEETSLQPFVESRRPRYYL